VGFETLESRRLLSGGSLTPVAPSDPFAGNTTDNVPQQELFYGSTNYSDSQVEPYVIANPRRANNLVGIWEQDRWSDGGARGLVVSVSIDHGNSWKAVPLPGITLTTGGTFVRASDPWLSFAPNGDLYAISVALNPPFGPSAPLGSFESAILVSKSTDGGLSWGDPITLIDTVDPLAVNDKETITADPTNSNYIYAVWDEPRTSLPPFDDFFGPTYFARSTDGGKTWEPARVIYDPGIDMQTIGNQILVLPNGNLVDVFTNPDLGVIEFVQSTNHGATWSPNPTVIARADFASVFDPNNGQYVRTGDLFQEATVDPRSGNLYVVWQDGRFTQNNGVSVAFTMSIDGGQTWSNPIPINQTPTNIPVGDRQAFNPRIAVEGDGTVAVTYYDLRNAASGPGLPTDFWAVLAKPSSPTNRPAGLTNPGNWNHEVRLTVSSFDLEQAPVANGPFVGDSTGLTSSRNRFLALFAEAGTDGAGTSVVYSRWFGPFGAADRKRAAIAGVSAAALFRHDAGADPDRPLQRRGLDPPTPVFGTPNRRCFPDSEARSPSAGRAGWRRRGIHPRGLPTFRIS
jgi:hypothetical protein